MSCSTQLVPQYFTRAALRICRYCLYGLVLCVCGLAFTRTWVAEAFEIPTGSMAPSLRGRHRVCACPNCGHDVVVGRHDAENNDGGRPRHYHKAFCQNCDFMPLPVAESAEIAGDRVLVNKAAYLVRSPSRWEIVVFRLFGTFYIKRLLGLPGEEISIREGDFYVNGRLCRKSIEEAKKLRVLLSQRELGTLSTLGLDADKCEPIRDEYAYNAGVHANSECVHDFSIETGIEVAPGRGTLSLRLCDGHDWVEVRLPVGETKAVEAFAWPMCEPQAMRKLGDGRPVGLSAGRCYRVELAFVDRRLSLALDGVPLFQADLPEATKRAGVVRPFHAEIVGVDATVRGFRLYRDVHYGQQGTNAVRGKSVRLGVDQYFLLGDNSPHSQDSRFWPDDGAVDRSSLLGPVLWVRRTHGE